MDTKSVIVRALEIDSLKLSANPSSFKKVNEFQYSLAINTWFAALRNISGEKAVIAVSFEVIRQGLVATIEDAVSTSNALVRDGDIGSLPAAWCWVCQNLTLRSALQILRYLKRFTPIACDLLDAACITSYKNRINTNKMRDRQEACTYITSRARAVCAEILGDISFGKRMCNGIPEVFFTEGYFSTGVCWDAVPNCVKTKVGAWRSPNFGDVMYPVASIRKVNPYYWKHWFKHKAKAVCVPKSYKAKRIIAEEETERQFYMQGLRIVCRKTLSESSFSKNLELDRQESQQRRCFDPSWATIDLSSASDSITVSIANDILPPEVFNASLALRSHFVDIGGVDYLNTIYQTSGSAWCFDSESYIFYSVCEACQRWKATYTGEDYLPVFVYGDDIEVDCRCYDECIEWLETLGFKVNHDKSFGPGSNYRESCGVEVCDGVEVSTSYWPRKEIRESKESISSLISLNDRLINVEWIESHMMVLEAIRALSGDKFTTTNVLAEGYSTDPRSIVTPISIPVYPRKVYKEWENIPAYEGHLCVTEQPSKQVDGPEEDLDMFRYISFLLKGPRYEDELSALLNISTSYRVSSEARCNMRTALNIRPLI
jgi:hypothetical protein